MADDQDPLNSDSNNPTDPNVNAKPVSSPLPIVPTPDLDEEADADADETDDKKATADPSAPPSPKPTANKNSNTNIKDHVEFANQIAEEGSKLNRGFKDKVTNSLKSSFKGAVNTVIQDMNRKQEDALSPPKGADMPKPVDLADLKALDPDAKPPAVEPKTPDHDHDHDNNLHHH